MAKSWIKRGLQGIGAALLLLLLLVLAIVALLLLDIPRNAAGMAAKGVCSAAFVALRPWQTLLAEDVLPASPALAPIRVRVDEDQRSVTARFAGMFARTARLLPQRGCVLDAAAATTAPTSPRARPLLASTRAWPLGEGRGYGAQTWRYGDPDAGRCKAQGVPADTLAMSGHWGQLVAVVPSRDAVVVRLGWTFRRGQFDGCAFLAAALKALPH